MILEGCGSLKRLLSVLLPREKWDGKKQIFLENSKEDFLYG
jgi:hypothetical protein